MDPPRTPRLTHQGQQRDGGDAGEQIQWIHREQSLYKQPLTEYPDVEDIGGSLDLFYRLFYVIGRWQKAEKKYAVAILRYVLYYLLTYLVSLVHTQPGTQRLLKQK